MKIKDWIMSWFKESDEYGLGIPELVEQGWPEHLADATEDEFEYALMAHDTIYYFRHAKDMGGGWVRIFANAVHDSDGDVLERECELYHGGKPLVSSHPPCPRGLDLRIDDIQWCAKAPFGS